MKRIFIVSMLLSTYVFAATSLDIYSDKIRLNDTKVVNNNIAQFTVPAHLDIEAFDTISSCDIDKKMLSTEIEVKDIALEKLNSELNQNRRLLNSLKAAENLFKTVSLDKISLEDFDKVEKKTTTLLLANLKEQGETEEIIKEQNLNISKYLELNPATKTRVLTVRVACNNKNSTVNIAYDFEELDVKTVKKIYGDLNKKEIKIDEFLYVKNLSSLILNDVTIRSFGANYVKAVSPVKFNPQYLDRNNRIFYGVTSDITPLKSQSVSVQKSVTTTNFNQGVIQNLDTLTAWQINSVNIPRNEGVELNLNTQILPSEFSIFIDGYNMNYPFVQAKLQVKNVVSKGDAKFYLNRQNIADGYIPALLPTIEENLYFGTNNHIIVTKKELLNFTENSIFNSKKQTQIWEYEIKNNSDKAWKITLAERLPVSKSDQIIVTLKSKDTPSLQKEEGETFFDFTLAPKEVKKIEFGYDTKMPKK